MTPLVLLVDDDTPCLDALERRLTARGYRVCVADTRDAGAQSLQGDAPHLCVMNPEADDSGGWELMTECARASIPLVLYGPSSLFARRQVLAQITHPLFVKGVHGYHTVVAAVLEQIADSVTLSSLCKHPHRAA